MLRLDYPESLYVMCCNSLDTVLYARNILRFIETFYWRVSDLNILKIYTRNICKGKMLLVQGGHSVANSIWFQFAKTPPDNHFISCAVGRY